MKKTIVCVILGLAIVLVALICAPSAAAEEGNGAYLRVHIRANSNGQEDQSVKYLVRDGVVEYLTPVVAECATKQAAVEAIGQRLSEIVSAAEGILNRNGFYYGARASIRKEEFPTRVYEGATLSAGVYDALILELGTGEGDNWWCVVYPPLCFSGGNGNVVYRSKIAEIIKNFMKDES